MLLRNTQDSRGSNFPPFQVSLARVLCDNAEDIRTIQPLAFQVYTYDQSRPAIFVNQLFLKTPDVLNRRVACDSGDIPSLNLTQWAQSFDQKTSLGEFQKAEDKCSFNNTRESLWAPHQTLSHIQTYNQYLCSLNIEHCSMYTLECVSWLIFVLQLYIKTIHGTVARI